MRVVLYTEDMEPITVIDLTTQAKKYLSEYGMVRLAVLLPPMLSVITEKTPPALDSIKTVSIYVEGFIRHGRKHMLLFTRDEESALLLKCAFLAGQQAVLQENERVAFSRGFLKALALVGDA